MLLFIHHAITEMRIYCSALFSLYFQLANLCFQGTPSISSKGVWTCAPKQVDWKIFITGEMRKFMRMETKPEHEQESVTNKWNESFMEDGVK